MCDTFRSSGKCQCDSAIDESVWLYNRVTNVRFLIVDLFVKKGCRPDCDKTVPLSQSESRVKTSTTRLSPNFVDDFAKVVLRTTQLKH
jgi:hypothetical protein